MLDILIKSLAGLFYIDLNYNGLNERRGKLCCNNILLCNNLPDPDDPLSTQQENSSTMGNPGSSGNPGDRSGDEAMTDSPEASRHLPGPSGAPGEVDQAQLKKDQEDYARLDISKDDLSKTIEENRIIIKTVEDGIDLDKALSESAKSSNIFAVQLNEEFSSFFDPNIPIKASLAEIGFRVAKEQSSVIERYHTVSAQMQDITNKYPAASEDTHKRSRDESESGPSNKRSRNDDGGR